MRVPRNLTRRVCPLEIATVLMTLAGIAALGIMSPGPDFLAVTHAAVTSSRYHAASVATGVVLGNGVLAGAALFGVGALFALFPTFFVAFKVIGGSYLILMGLKMILGAKKPLESKNTVATTNQLKGFVKGFTVTMANPKAAIYYASALTAVAPKDASLSLLALMVAVVFCVAAVWFTCVVMFLSLSLIHI